MQLAFGQKSVVSRICALSICVAAESLIFHPWNKGSGHFAITSIYTIKDVLRSHAGKFTAPRRAKRPTNRVDL
jgi:hypothetical protein